MSVSKLGESDKILLAFDVFKGKALDWLMNETAKAMSIGIQPFEDSWHSFCRALNENFSEKFDEYDLAEKLGRLRISKSVSDYAEKFHIITSKLPEMPEFAKIGYLWRASDMQTKKELSIRLPTTFKEAIIIARTFWKLEFKPVPPTKPMNNRSKSHSINSITENIHPNPINEVLEKYPSHSPKHSLYGEFLYAYMLRSKVFTLKEYIRGVEVEVILDSGSTVSFIDHALAKKLCILLRNTSTSLIKTAGN